MHPPLIGIGEGIMQMFRAARPLSARPEKFVNYHIISETDGGNHVISFGG